MKRRTAFRIRQRGCPRVVYQIVRRLNPSAVRVDDIRIEARSGESLLLVKIAGLVALCRAFGMKRSKLGDSGTYGYVVMREYERADLDSCQLLVVFGILDRNLECDEERDAEGRLVLHSHNLARLIDFGQVNHRIVVSDAARRSLERGGFEGLNFRSVSIRHPRPSEFLGSCWELSTTVLLPRIANTQQLMCYGHEEEGAFRGDYSKMVFIDDPPYAGGEVHYRSSDLRNLGHFDIAQTFENLWIPQRSFVISQRFYQHCLTNKIPIEVRPVRIDSD